MMTRALLTMGLVLSLLTTATHAGSVDLTYVDVDPAKKVQVRLERDSATLTSGWIWAGVMNFTDGDGRSWATFCIDVLQYVRNTGPVTYEMEEDLTAAPLGGSNHVTMSLEGADALDELYGETIAPLSLLTLNDWQAAYLQLVVWEYSHERSSNGFSLRDGDFTADLDAQHMDAIDTILAGVSDNGADAIADLVALTHNDYQDQLIIAPPTDSQNDDQLVTTPTPTAAGAGLALVGILTLIARRSRRA